MSSRLAPAAAQAGAKVMVWASASTRAGRPKGRMQRGGGVAHIQVGQDRQTGIVHHFLQDGVVFGLVALVHRLADEQAVHNAEHAGFLEGGEHPAVLVRGGLLLAGFQQQEPAAPVLQRGEEAVAAADGRGIGIAGAVEQIKQRVDAAAEDGAAEPGRALQQQEALVRVGGHLGAGGFGGEIGAAVVPDRAGGDLPDGAGADQFLKIPAGVGQHPGAELAHIRQKALAVEGGQPQLVEHQVVDRRVRKAQEDLGAQGAFQLPPAEKAGQQPVGVVPADGAEDHVGLLVPESLQQIGGPGFGVGGQVSPAGQRVGCKFDPQAQVPQPLQAQVQLVPDEVFPQRTGRQADDGDGLDHGGRLPSRLDGPGPPEKNSSPSADMRRRRRHRQGNFAANCVRGTQ